MGASGHRAAGGRRRALVVAAALMAGAGLAIAGVIALIDGGGASMPRTPGARAPLSVSTAPISTTPPAPGPAALAPPTNPSFGVNFDRLFNDRTYSAELVDRQLEAARSDGVRLARSDSLWELSEPQPPRGGLHRYDWTFDDGVIDSLAVHGVRWLAILDYSPRWAASAPSRAHSPPRSADDFAAFAAAFATRYGRGGELWRRRPDLPVMPVTTYEIWNEPDSPLFWAPMPDPRRYIDLYLRARNAIKQVDAKARVLIGGLTDPDGFLPKLLGSRPDARGHIDGVAVHPYASTPREVLARVRGARRTLDALGMGHVPIYVTEFGWATSPPSSRWFASPRLRPGYLASASRGLARLDCGLGGIFLYTWVTPERNRADEADWFGVRHPDARPSPSSRALAAVLKSADRLRRQPRVRMCGPPSGG
jgi:polysaccharide biosynthesis protein PslG